MVKGLLLAVSITVFCASSSNAMSSLQFDLVRPPSKLYEMIGSFWAINISGEIPADAHKRFVEFLESSGAPNRIEVYLNSPGGSVVGGIALGRELRARQMNTSVGKVVPGGENKPGVCYSACTLAYLGGYFRYIDERSHFGVHRFYFQNPSPYDADVAQILSASIANYVHDMGIDIAFMALSAAKAGTDLEIVPHDILRNLRVVNGGYTREEWTMQGIEGSLYVRGERDTYFGHQKILLYYDANGMQFYRAAVFETRNRDEELNMMKQIDIELDSHMIDVSNRAYTMAIRNGYFNIQIPISLNEARMLAASKSAGVIMRFGPDAPVFLGISGMNVDSGRHLVTGLINAYAR